MQHTTFMTLMLLVTQSLPLHSEIGTTSYLCVKSDTTVDYMQLQQQRYCISLHNLCISVFKWNVGRKQCQNHVETHSIEWHLLFGNRTILAGNMIKWNFLNREIIHGLWVLWWDQKRQMTYIRKCMMQECLKWVLLYKVFKNHHKHHLCVHVFSVT
jgi:hypothetical protein